MKTRAARASTADRTLYGRPPSPTVSNSSSSLSDIGDGSIGPDPSPADVAAAAEIEQQLLASDVIQPPPPAELSGTSGVQAATKRAGGGSKRGKRAKPKLTGDKLEMQRAKNRVKQAKYRARISNTIVTLRDENEELTALVDKLKDQVAVLERDLVRERAKRAQGAEGRSLTIRPKEKQYSTAKKAQQVLSTRDTSPSSNAHMIQQEKSSTQLPTPLTPAYASFDSSLEAFDPRGSFIADGTLSSSTAPEPPLVSSSPRGPSALSRGLSNSVRSGVTVEREHDQRSGPAVIGGLRRICEDSAVSPASFSPSPIRSLSYDGSSILPAIPIGGIVRTSPAALTVPPESAQPALAPRQDRVGSLWAWPTIPPSYPTQEKQYHPHPNHYVQHQVPSRPAPPVVRPSQAYASPDETFSGLPSPAMSLLRPLPASSSTAGTVSHSHHSVSLCFSPPPPPPHRSTLGLRLGCPAVDTSAAVVLPSVDDFTGLEGEVHPTSQSTFTVKASLSPPAMSVDDTALIRLSANGACFQAASDNAGIRDARADEQPMEWGLEPSPQPPFDERKPELDDLALALGQHGTEWMLGGDGLVSGACASSTSS